MDDYTYSYNADDYSDSSPTPTKALNNYNGATSTNLIHPYNIPFYTEIYQNNRDFSQESYTKTNGHSLLLNSLSQYPLPLLKSADFSRLNGIDKSATNLLQKIKGNEDESNLMIYKKRRLAEARMFCKLLFNENSRSQNNTLVMNPSSNTAKKFYTPPSGSGPWSALVLFFLFHTKGYSHIRLYEITTASMQLSTLIPASKVDGTTLGKLIKLKLLSFQNEAFTSKPEKKPLRYMSKMAYMYYYNITEEGLETARNLVAKVAKPIQSLLDIIPNPGEDKHVDEICTPTRSLNPLSKRSIALPSLTDLSKSRIYTSMTPIKSEYNDSDLFYSLDKSDFSGSLSQRAEEEPFDLVVVIDNREFGGNRSRYHDILIDVLNKENIRYKFLNLPLGDIVWVAQLRPTGADRKNPNYSTTPFVGDAYVLSCIIERKTLSDLQSSILDGRYDEQRKRLMDSGMRQIIYLYENSADSADTSFNASYWKKHLNPKVVASAKSNIQFINGFNIVNTTSPSHTAGFIVRFHRAFKAQIHDLVDQDNAYRLMSWFANPDNCLNWEKWSVQTRKSSNITYKQVFGRQLRCIPTCGPMVTAAILAKWPRPYQLYTALAGDEDILSGIAAGKRKSIRTKLVQHILKLYKKQLESEDVIELF